MNRIIHAIAALLIAAPASAQNVPLQGGPWAGGHTPMYSVSGASQPIIQDPGTAAGGAAGVGLSEFLQVNRTGNGDTTAPFASNGNGPLGTHNCFYDGPTTGQFHYLCLDANAQGGGLITYGAGGGATALPFEFNINGVTWNPLTGSVSSIVWLPQVTNLSGLQSLTAGAYTTVQRLGYTTAGDGGYALYTWSSSACSISSGAGDNGYQVKPNAGTGCWIASFPASGADVRVWGAVADGATDAGPAINTAIADYSGPILIPATTSGFYINTTVINTGALLGVNYEPLNNMGSSNAYPGTSWLKCSRTVNPCVQEGAAGTLTSAPQIENIILAGVTGTPNSGAVGLWFAGGYNITSRNTFSVNFDTCYKWGGVASSLSISATHYKLDSGACQTHFLTIDGWPEVRIYGGREGLNGSGDYTAPSDFVYFTHSQNIGSGGGPNTILLDGVHFNPASGGPACAFNWAGWNGTGGLQAEFRLINNHVEWHNYTGSSSQGIFCSDSTVPSISSLFVSHMLTSTGSISVPAFNLNSATALSKVFFDNNIFGCTGITLAPTPASGASFTDVHFEHNFGCSSASFTSNGVGNNTFFSEGNNWGPSFTIAGSWYNFNSHADYYGYSLTDTATGFIGMSNLLSTAWTPALHFGTSGSVTCSVCSGKWYRTPQGGFHARFNVTLSAISSPTGTMTITGLPTTPTCNTIGSQFMLETSTGTTGVTGVIAENFSGSSNTINLVQSNGSGGWTALTGAALTSSTSMIGEVECLQAN